MEYMKRKIDDLLGFGVNKGNMDIDEGVKVKLNQLIKQR